MSWVTVIWSMVAAVCLTLAAMHALIWCMRRTGWTHLLFAVSASAMAVFVGCELWRMRAATPATFGSVSRWGQVPLWVLIVSLTWIALRELQPRRRWLAWTTIGVRTMALLLNFMTGQSLTYREITALKQVRFLGEPVSVAMGVPNPWFWLAPLSSLMLVLFVADAGVTAWRRGDRRKAMLVGGSITFFVTVGQAQAVLVNWAGIQMPITLSWFYLGIIVVMGFELSYDLLRAAKLARELRESEQRLDLAAHAAGLGVWVWDILRDDIWTTDKARLLFGLAAPNRIDFGRFVSTLHPDDRMQFSHAVANALNGDGDFESDYRVVIPGRPTRWVSARGRVEFDGGGKPTIMRGVLLDISERKHGEETLRQSELEAHELRQELAHASRVTMLGQLASSLAHELSQPLGAILRNAEAAEMLLQHPSPDLDELRAIVADICKDDHRAGDVIDRLRALLKRRSLEAHPLGLKELVEEVVALVRSDADARRVKLVASVPSDLPPVRGDRVHLQQVLLNLIINGMDAVQAEPDDVREVQVGARSDADGMIEVSVSDSGHGVPPEGLDRLFEPFFTTKPLGMGLGLPISRTIVEAHGGRIWAENNANRGTMFRFTLATADGGAAV